jgi:UDP-N-acetylglucosamine--N-acetylmuramyl-(pentapeptide) pyrophosphoryl-undecaprenol N-acetylglucosamine transferase
MQNAHVNKAAGAQKSKNIVLAAGGTGGHIFPAEALAEELLTRGYDPHLITDKRFEDYRAHQAYGALMHVDVHMIASAKGQLRGLNAITNSFAISKGVLQARQILKKLNPLAVVGFGGYPSLPTMMAARARGEVSVLQEQNAVLGRVNRLLASGVKGLALTYADTQKIPESAQDHVRHIGNPVRAQMRALYAVEYSAPRGDSMLRLLVIGGSQGAKIFSDIIPQAIGALPEELRPRIRIDQQCRPEDVEAVKAAYKALNLQADVQAFFNDMSARLASAHLVIARAGASSISELCVVGRPAILVPLPAATDNHQYFNAQAVEDIGGGVVMPQTGFTPQALAARLETYASLPDSLEDAAHKIRLLARPNAASDLADYVLQLAGVMPAQSEENISDMPAIDDVPDSDAITEDDTSMIKQAV